MNLGLEGKIALVTAASRGLGFATARELVREGAQVVICGRNEERLETAVAELQNVAGEAVAVGLVADVSNPADVRQLVSATVETFGGLDILITNAGGPPGGTFDSFEAEAWQKAVNLTLMSAIILVQESLPHLRDSEAGSILTITSTSAKQPISGLILSNVVRPAVLGLTKSLSQELGPDGIRVNSILPGWTATERVAELMDYNTKRNGTTVAEEVTKISAAIPLGRIGQPEEFGRVAAFLVSPAASFISGVMLPVDGGRYGGLL
ncbi:MAG: SDR family oxidoreductase [Candidatus Promineifilaceae bacterium]